MEKRMTTMTADGILKGMRTLGTEGYKKVIMKQGAKEPCYGVKIGDLKKIQKRIGGTDHRLALDLYDTGVSDAMYLAGLIADDPRMTKRDLQRWVEKAYWPMLSEYTVPWVAAGGPHGRELGLKWIESDTAGIAAAGWSTLGGIASITDDADLDIDELGRLLRRVQETIHQQPNRVRYVMNGFVIGIGSYVAPLTDTALRAAGKIGPVTVDMGGTACKVPQAAEYIEKVRKRGTIGRKRKALKC